MWGGGCCRLSCLLSGDLETRGYLLGNLVAHHTHHFLLALVLDAGGWGLHLHLHVPHGRFFLGLELLEGKQVNQLLILLIHLRQRLRLVPVGVYFLVNVANYAADAVCHGGTLRGCSVNELSEGHLSLLL